MTVMRPLMRGMGEAVARRTIFRHLGTQHEENWFDVSVRVAHGNTKLHPSGMNDFSAMQQAIATGKLLMSGRHLQHSDATQPSRALDPFTNCSTSATSHVLFLLLLNGSGVGRSYDDVLMLVDWAKYMPMVRCVLSPEHSDYKIGEHDPSSHSRAEAKAKQGQTIWDEQHKSAHHFVHDSREGWAKAIELVETLTFTKKYADYTIYLDFTAVRREGSPIGGMQGRPASGPAAFMTAVQQIVEWVYRQELKPWKATMMVDHFLAECVMVGGARRSARLGTKWWGDSDILEFISFKADYLAFDFPVFWSSNNSIGVDAAFWQEAKIKGTRASEVWQAAAEYSYGANGKRRLGEPGFLNFDQLIANEKGIEVYEDGEVLASDKFTQTDLSKELYRELYQAVKSMKYKFICNPCGEISLFVLAGYCVIADVVPLYCTSINDVKQTVVLAAKALIRANTLPCLYTKEVRRTNRIGIGFTGFHEWAWSEFEATWHDLLTDEEGAGRELWGAVGLVRDFTLKEIEAYCRELDVPMPHSIFTCKPAGTTSKLFGLTEGAHLPAMKAYLRNVQFKNDDPLVEQYRQQGYPVRDLTQYKGMTIVGFPTVPTLSHLMPAPLIVTASEATPAEQYQYLRLYEKYWLGEDYGNQLSYTLKVDTDVVSFEEFADVVLNNQGTIRACSVMPVSSSEMAQAYEYMPEEAMSVPDLLAIIEGISDNELKEAIDYEHLACSSGACPI